MTFGTYVIIGAILWPFTLAFAVWIDGTHHERYDELAALVVLSGILSVVLWAIALPMISMLAATVYILRRVQK